MFKLRVQGDINKDIWLVEPGITAGSQAGCELVIDNARDHHVEIKVDGSGQLSLNNLAGDTSVKINGKTITDASSVQVGDSIEVAGTSMQIVDPKAEAAAKPAAAPVPAGKWSIKANHSALNNRQYEIEGKKIVGRSNDCDITLSVTHLSRQHAELTAVGDTLTVKDLDSANGTYVNGKKITQQALNNGDELRLDTLSFTVVGPGGGPEEQDMDKTSVRAAFVPPPTLTEDAGTEKRKPVAKPAPAKPRPAPNKPATPKTPEPEAESGGSQMVIAAGVVGAVIIIGLIAYLVL
jgi:pSer/pThr/pTyr-binding forkhead associated (FHA) protein